MSDFDTKQKKFWDVTTNLRTVHHPVVQGFSNQRMDFISGLLQNPVNSILEVGCGDGFGMWFMKDITKGMFGCDISISMLHKNPSKDRVCLADAYKLPFQDKKFDMVTCWELLHHIAKPLDVVREMTRVSRRYILIFEPNVWNPAQIIFALLTPAERGTFRFTPRYIRSLVEKAEIQNYMIKTGGWFTPNRTPILLFKLLKKLPYTIPLFGISNILFGEKSDKLV
ncbi:class I SAM-dependent methyltransferase [candidate division KSB1 bacterium]|nr:class I SAM-dependent methyltransferase [candidate division KSB1 bacterium]